MTSHGPSLLDLLLLFLLYDIFCSCGYLALSPRTTSSVSIFHKAHRIQHNQVNNSL